MIELREGEAAPVDLSDGDVAHLETVAGGVFSAGRRDTVSGKVHITVRRHAGLWTLPSGRTLCIHPRKGGAADLLAWLAAVDPFMQAITWGHLVRWGGGEGAVTTVLVRTFCGALLASEFIRRFYDSGGANSPAAAWRLIATDADPRTRALAASWRVFGRP